MKITREKIEELAKAAHLMEVPNWLRVDENQNEPYYRFLFLLAQELNSAPTTMVELGTWRGVSAMCMAEGAPGARIVTFDVHQQVRDMARRGNIFYANKSSIEANPDLKPVDLLFIDTEHDGALPLAEFKAWEPYLAPNAIVLFDDILLESMKEFWSNFSPRGEKFELNVHASGFGCVLMRETEETA